MRTELAWVIACVGAQCLSMAAFALVQRCLLKAGGARLTASWLMSTAYLANVIAISVPVIGSGMAASYAYHQFRVQRADPTVAKAALTLAGVLSTAAFAVIVVAVAITAKPHSGRTRLSAAPIPPTTPRPPSAVTLRGDPSTRSRPPPHPTCNGRQLSPATIQATWP